jgi:hypothetical protein
MSRVAVHTACASGVAALETDFQHADLDLGIDTHVWRRGPSSEHSHKVKEKHEHQKETARFGDELVHCCHNTIHFTW